jgi:transcriptional regulator with XRE-family HTH domain
MSLATKLKELRVRRKQSLQDVADAIGASKTHVWDLETGRSSNPSVDLLTKLATHFQVRIADLVGENPNSADEDEKHVALFRELKQLSDPDLETIRILMQRLKDSDRSSCDADPAHGPADGDPRIMAILKAEPNLPIPVPFGVVPAHRHDRNPGAYHPRLRGRSADRPRAKPRHHPGEERGVAAASQVHDGP